MRSDPMIGRTLPGGYVVQHLAGIGGMGRVYLAEQTALGRTVAVKVIHPHLVGDESNAGRFITEARAASRLNHPNSIAIFDFGTTEDGQLYLVMEYLRGKDLAHVIDHEPPLGFHRIADILRQTLAALEEAHELGIIHRDLKPENIVLEQLRTGRDFVKVFDYGLAKILDAKKTIGDVKGARIGTLTVPGFVCGTPEYMSPEQARGAACDGRSDLYAVGVILYQLLTRQLPFEGDTSTRVLLAHLNDAPIDPRVRAPERNIPDSLAEITLRALAKNPDDRYATAHELALALATAGFALPPGSTRPAPRSTPPVRESETSVVTVTSTCDACDAENVITHKYCGDCGAPLAGQRPSQPASEPMPESRARLKERPIRPDDDLTWLEAHREAARSMPAHARLKGPSGIGKTTLVRAFLERCASRGDVVVRIDARASAAEVSGFAVREAIAALAGGARTTSSGTLDFGDGAPPEWAPSSSPHARSGVRDLFGPAASAANDTRSPDERRRCIADALKWAMRRASEQRGAALVVLAVDDLDDIDGVSRNAFVDVMNEPPLVRSLLVVTYANDPTGTPASVGDEHVINGIYDESSADRVSPMLVEERTRWERSAKTVGMAVPTQLGEIVTKRIALLSPEARWLLQAIAVLGDDCDEGTLARALPAHVDFHAARALLDDDGFVRATRITHPLLRQVTLASAPRGVLGELHTAALELRGESAPIETRAYHAANAALSGSPRNDASDGAQSRCFEALLLLERASAIRAARGDVDGSIAALRRALDLSRREMFRGELEDPVAAILLFSRKLADALSANGAHEGAEGVLREALDLAPPNDADRAQLLASLARVAHARAREEEAKGYVKEALRLARRSDARELVRSLESLERSIAS